MRYLLVIAVLSWAACLDTGKVPQKIKDDLNKAFDPNPQAMSCLLSAVGECMDFVDKRWTETQARELCEAASRSRLVPMLFHPRQACSSVKEVYRCERQLKKGKGYWVRNVLYSPQFDKERARRVCR